MFIVDVLLNLLDKVRPRLLADDAHPSSKGAMQLAQNRYPEIQVCKGRQ